ncbi:MAG: ATP-dependent RecD-like DNA helicase [Oscillospiraceae bacterium]|jgi:exodeoxyribonuclease V alpha subunit|nr:ATP-dependent RecD-like DNA helicase [Oscillospiraceae bacterium]
METIEAQVDEVVFHNNENGFTVLSIRCGDKRVSAVGTLPVLTMGESVTLTGEWQEHSQYGKQFRISSCEWTRPDSPAGMERMLAAGWIKGIGPSTAKRLVAKFGMDTLDILQFAPDKLAGVSGIGRKRAKMIAESYGAQQGMREAMIFLQGFGILPNLALRIYKEYADKAADVLRRNPYQMIEDIRGVGFKTADDVARSMGVAPDSSFRIQAGILHTLQLASVTDGHCYLPRDILFARAGQLLGAPADLIERELTGMILTRKLVAKELEQIPVIFLSGHYEAEGEVARRLLALRDSAPRLNADHIPAQIGRFERETNTRLDELQREAVLSALRDGICAITGGPGTGKTTIIRCLLSLIGESADTALAAPTGRAAKRMSEATGKEAKTIHRLLEYGGDEDVFQRNEENPLECVTLIVDEMSMVDIFLMRALLRALRPGVRLVLVGDADQLPSVGPGSVLGDIIASGSITNTHLKKVYRQSEHSMIAVNAHSINAGTMPSLNDKQADFFLERQPTAEAAAKTLVELYAKRLPAFLNIEGNPCQTIQALSPMKKGDCGVWAINRMLQDRLNPKADDKPELSRGDTLFRLGDKVMQIRNNYKLEWTRGDEEGQGAFNGDIGYVGTIDPEERMLIVKFDDDRVASYESAQLEDLELAYCISVHKSQGSEFPVVLMPVVGGPPMLLTRNLLYTAVTRAKRLLVMVGREDALRKMVENHRIEKRFSALETRLREKW